MIDVEFMNTADKIDMLTESFSFFNFSIDKSKNKISIYNEDMNFRIKFTYSIEVDDYSTSSFDVIFPNVDIDDVETIDDIPERSLKSFYRETMMNHLSLWSFSPEDIIKQNSFFNEVNRLKVLIHRNNKIVKILNRNVENT